MTFNVKVTLTVGLTTKDGQQLDEDYVVQGVIAPVLHGIGQDGFSVTENVGYWKGQPEKSLTVTVFGNANELLHSDVLHAAHMIATACKQECVLWSRESCAAGLEYAK